MPNQVWTMDKGQDVIRDVPSQSCTQEEDAFATYTMRQAEDNRLD